MKLSMTVLVVLIAFVLSTKAQDTMYVHQNTGMIIKIAVNSIDSVKFAATPLTDFDGNIYHTVTIGTQTWMIENLRTTHYNDGNLIPNVTTGWGNLINGAYCDYNNSATYGDKYGHLYNWYAVNSGKLAPKGWHIPTYDEWNTLINYLGGYTIAGGKLKSLTYWTSPNTGASNSTGFSSLPGGLNGPSGFLHASSYGHWWSSSVYSSSMSWLIYMSYNNTQCLGNMVERYSGLSVRCLKN